MVAVAAQLEETLARAICAGFWQGAPAPRPWDSHSTLAQDLWRTCARRAIDVARQVARAGPAAADQLEERTAEALCDTFFELSEMATRWPDSVVRQTFRDAARTAVKAGREFREQARGLPQ